MKIAICDDEKILCEQLRNYIKRQEFHSGSIDCYESGEAFLAASKRYDIIFLDIQMAGLNGIETAKRLRERKDEAVLIFVTGMKEYVFEAFDVSAFHYLIKPVQEEKFTEVFGKAVIEAERRRQKENGPEQLLISRRGYSMKLDKEEILYIESRQRKAVIHTTQKVLEIYATMNGLEKELGKPFYRCHRGYLVNLSRISGYTGDSITLCNGETIYLAREKYHGFVRAYMRYLRDGGTVCV